MAVVTRYFSTTSAGAGDGTTWADRAALFSSGDWPTVITGFDFSGSDSLVCRIGPGSYTCGQALATGLFANPPVLLRPLVLHAAQDGGDLWVPPDPGWVSSQPTWSETGMPVIATTTNISTTTLVPLAIRGLKFTASDRSGVMVDGPNNADWCVFENSTDSTSNIPFSVGNCATNCVGRAFGDRYAVIVQSGTSRLCDNIRCVGIPTGSSGTRIGFGIGTLNTSASINASRITVIDNDNGPGISLPNTSAAARVLLANCLVAGATTGIFMPGNSAPTQTSQVTGCVVVKCSAYGIAATANLCNALIANNRLRNNTSGNFNGFGNYPTDNNDTSSGTDADEFVDSAGGDYRIKNTSDLWGKGYGAGDEPAAGGGGGGFYVSQSARMLR
jgi:hypothetical protein